jgi:hypothetical protein
VEYSVPAGVTSSKAITLCPVCSFCNFKVAVLPGAIFYTGSCQGSVTKGLVSIVVPSSESRHHSRPAMQPLLPGFHAGVRNHVLRGTQFHRYQLLVQNQHPSARHEQASVKRRLAPCSLGRDDKSDESAGSLVTGTFETSQLAPLLLERRGNSIHVLGVISQRAYFEL